MASGEAPGPQPGPSLSVGLAGHRLALPAPPPWPPTQQSWSAALHSRPSPRWRARLAEMPLLSWCEGCGPGSRPGCPANQGNQPVHMPRPWRTLDPKRPASLGSGTGLGRAVLPKTQPRTQSRGAPALPRPVHTAREHIHGGWHTSALSQALRGREPTGRGLPSSPQGGGP
ncbi:homeobox protein CDX-1-like [Bos indicus x Bos taurus]|uniref:homeobox protein CDX-1-like n=1 Tax=Bos indicus x Bos taurus TaxID=30522 RepID=UPI000F7D581E|nr:homeobox protein CDX-1-like [Bos indicus x Bos taurus]